jgi:hypothetical protein
MLIQCTASQPVYIHRWELIPISGTRLDFYVRPRWKIRYRAEKEKCLYVLWRLARAKSSVEVRSRRSRSGSITVVILPRCTYIDTESNTSLANRKASHAATNALTTESFYGNLTGAFFSGHPEVRKRLRLPTVYWVFLNEGVPLDPECNLPGLQSDTSCSVYATVSCKIIDVL